MSLTPQEIAKLKAIVADPDPHEYKYKGVTCQIGRALSAAELTDWQKRIDIIKAAST